MADGAALNLHQQLSKRVDAWRAAGYPHETYTAIGEVLGWSREPEGTTFRLRSSQLRALETYWYLRLVEATPHIKALYETFFATKNELIEALGVPKDAFAEADYELEQLWALIKENDDFAKRFKLEALRETLNLAYPSYILALAMGAGKTVLIGAIIATEFAMALEYPKGPFVQNALVFAPGKTIIESLRELAEINYQSILPPRLYKPFASSAKLTFTRDGEKDIPVVRGSVFNLIVTNTEKIRIQKETIKKSDIGTLLAFFKKAADAEDAAKTEIANLRLQKIASLPHLAIFSDEAHHTYGQALDTELKKVRKTVDYLAANTNLLCVVNTTGTPYYKRQPLRDVVFWYGLSEGIHDGILKELAGNIIAYNFDHEQAATFASSIVEDFFKEYGDVKLPNGAPAKLAMYFPQNEDLDELRPVIETKLAQLGLSPELCLRNTSESPQAEIDAFNRLNDPASPHRVILLVNKGTEGWNCPSLFACALVRKLRGSNNFVLQAATRCLRQVPGNLRKARVYLSMDNRNTLDSELRETYGETIEQLKRTEAKRRLAKITVRKLTLPVLKVKRTVRTVIRKPVAATSIRLSKPSAAAKAAITRTAFTLTDQESTKKILAQIGDAIEVAALPNVVDRYAAAVELASNYSIDILHVNSELSRLYPSEVPVEDIEQLAAQIEEQTKSYETKAEEFEDALAIVKLTGFEKEVAPDGTDLYTAEISYPISKEHLLMHWQSMQEKNAADLGFHYTPYNFDSNPEESFFEQLLQFLNQNPKEIADIYFTGAITDPKKTDFYIEYRGEDNRWHRYTPDFVLRRTDGRCLIVEIKSTQFEAATNEDMTRDANGQPVLTAEGRKAIALKRWTGLNPDQLDYEIIFVKGDTVGYEQTKKARDFSLEAA